MDISPRHAPLPRITFFGASLALVIAYAAAATPIPLYGLYRMEDGLTYGDLSMSSVVYFLGAVTALLVFGRLSNHLGRRPMAVLTLLLTGLACAVLTQVHGPAPLIAGRLLQGLSCGLASTALAAWLVDSAPTSPRWLAPTVVSCGPMFGLTLGGLGSGALIEYGPMPRLLPYGVMGASIIACVLLILGGRETVARQPGVLASLRPRFALPPQTHKAFPVAASVFVATWALGGFYQAFGPAMAREQLHSSSALAAAAVFASIMAPSVLGASLSGRLRPEVAQRAGMLVFTLAVGGVLFALSQGQLVLFLIASALAGAGQGATLSGSIQTLVAGTAVHERASVLSVIYATSYTGAAVPTLIAGRLSSHFSLLEVACGYGVLALAGSAAVLVSALGQTKPQAVPQPEDA